MRSSRKRRAFAVGTLLWLIAGAGGAEEGGVAAQTVATPTAAAAPLLDACWSAEALRGRLGERFSRTRLPPDHAVPVVASFAPGAGATHTAAGSIRSVIPAGGEKLVALTFDLCEKSNEVTGYDGELVDTLRAAEAKATFFASGKWLRDHAERAMQLMADPRFEIGNHGWTHGNLRVLRGDELVQQIVAAQVQYALLRERLLALPCAAPVRELEARRIPPFPAALRFPYGTCDATALRAVADAGLHAVQWSIVTGDPVKGQSAERIVRSVLAELRPGAIVVAHANGRGWHTAEAMKRLIPELRARGYRLVTVSELLASGRPEAAEACYELHPGDNLRYDRLFGRGTE